MFKRIIDVAKSYFDDWFLTGYLTINQHNSQQVEADLGIKWLYGGQPVKIQRLTDLYYVSSGVYNLNCLLIIVQ